MPRNQVVQNVVQETSNYDQFSFLNDNRMTVPGHVANLKKAFEEVGNLTKVQPILVNERYEIIDGQHRFQAARELQEPIFFTMLPGLRIENARHMNILHRTWNLDDFGASYAAAGNEDYIVYNMLKEDYGVNNSVLLSYALNDYNPTGAFSKFRKGDFTIGDLESTKYRLERLSQALEAVPHLKKDRSFALAYLKVQNTTGFDQARMLRKLNQVGESVVRRFANMADYLRALEEVYNFQISEANRLRLY